MSDQTPLPERPSAWSQDDEQTLPYGVPSPRPQQEPQQPPYDEQSSRPYYGPPQQPQYYEQPQHPQPPHQQAQHIRDPYQQAQYTQPPHQQQPQYPHSQYQYPLHPQASYQQQLPYDGQQHGNYQGPPRTRSKAPWLIAGAIAVVVALVVGAAAVIVSRTGGDDTADAPVPTDSVSTAPSSPTPTELPSSTPSEPIPTPTPAPTPTERRRTLKDVDKGIHVYDDVYINPASGWRQYRRTKYSVTLGSQSGAAMIIVEPFGFPAASEVGTVAEQLIGADHLTGVRKEPVKTLRPANSNIGSQAQLSYSGRYTTRTGAVVSLVSRCTSMTGVESIHNVSVTLCIAARKDARDVVFRDGARMLASVARSI